MTLGRYVPVWSKSKCSTFQAKYQPVSSVGRALVWRSGGPGFNSRCLPVLGMGSSDVVTGRGVGSRAAPVALQEEQESSHKWEQTEARVEKEKINKK